MSAIPRLARVDAVVIPANAEKTFPDDFISKIEVSNPDDVGDQQMLLQFIPYNYDTKEFDIETDPETMQFSIYDFASTYPLFGQGMGIIVAAVGLLKNKKDLEYKISLLDQNTQATQIAALNTQLDGVMTALNGTP
jgi:hypothetical protein